MGYFQDAEVWERATGKAEFTYHAPVRIVGLVFVACVVIDLAVVLLLAPSVLIAMLVACGFLAVVAVGMLLYRVEYRFDPILKRFESVKGIGPYARSTQLPFAEIRAVEVSKIKSSESVIFAVSLVGPTKPVKLKGFSKPEPASALAERIGEVIGKPVEAKI